MKTLIKPMYVSDNGDETSTFNCELLRDNITVKEFVETLRERGGRVNHPGSDSGFSSLFNEDFCTVYLVSGHDWWNEDAKVHIKFATREASCEEKVGKGYEMGPCSLDDLFKKFGGYIITSCRWNGGWGAGNYELRLKCDELYANVKRLSGEDGANG